jgi:hypothetical protein
MTFFRYGSKAQSKRRNIVSRNIYKVLVLITLIAIPISGCNSGQPEPAPQAVQVPQVQIAPPVQQAPVVQPVAAPPPTPLLPLAEEVAETKGSSGISSKLPKVDGVDVPLPGKQTEGDELIGNYACVLDAKDLPLGPFKLPALGCRIYRADDGSLNLGPTSRGIAGIRGTIQNPTEAGFFVTGGYKFPGNELGIKVRMQRKPGAQVVYSGKGRGMLNDDKNTKKDYTLTMTKK